MKTNTLRRYKTRQAKRWLLFVEWMENDFIPSIKNPKLL